MFVLLLLFVFIPRAEQARIPEHWPRALLTAAWDVTEFPAFVGIHRETPRAGLPVRVAAVIHLQVLVWKSGRARRILIALNIHICGQESLQMSKY